MPVRGVDGFFDLANDLRRAGDRELQRELGRGLDQAVAVVRREVAAAAPRALPDRYAAVLVPSLDVRGRRSQLKLRIQVSARGRSDDRDLPRIERGELRHPVYGRYRRGRGGRTTVNPWATTTVQRHWVARSFDRVADDITHHLAAAVDAVAARLGKG